MNMRSPGTDPKDCTGDRRLTIPLTVHEFWAAVSVICKENSKGDVQTVMIPARNEDGPKHTGVSCDDKTVLGVCQGRGLKESITFGLGFGRFGRK
jgi:hypothetical protein